MRCHHQQPPRDLSTAAISTPTPTPERAAPQAAPAPSDPAPGGGRGVGSRLSWLGLAVSLLALAGVVWWASRQDAPDLPSSGTELTALVGAIALYALATVVRSERWHRLLVDEGAVPERVDTYALTCVGYMGNNVLPARAGDAIRIVLMAPRAQTSMRTVIGTLLAERLLDVAVLVVIFVVVGYGLLGEVGGDKVEIIVLVAGAVLVAGLRGVPVRAPQRAARRLPDADRVRHARPAARPPRAPAAGDDAADLGDRGRRVDVRRRHRRLRHGPDRRALHRRARLGVLADPVRPRVRRHAGRRGDPRHQGARRHRRAGGRLHRDAAVHHRRPDHASSGSCCSPRATAGSGACAAARLEARS